MATSHRQLLKVSSPRRMRSNVRRGVRVGASQNGIVGNCASYYYSIRCDRARSAGNTISNSHISPMTTPRSHSHIARLSPSPSVAFKLVVVVGADSAWSCTRRLVSLAQPTYIGVTFVKIQHNLQWETLMKCHWRRWYREAGRRGSNGRTSGMATLVECGTLLAVGDRRIITVQRNCGNVLRVQRPSGDACASRYVRPHRRREGYARCHARTLRGMGTKVCGRSSMCLVLRDSSCVRCPGRQWALPPSHIGGLGRCSGRVCDIARRRRACNALCRSRCEPCHGGRRGYRPRACQGEDRF